MTPSPGPSRRGSCRSGRVARRIREPAGTTADASTGSGSERQGHRQGAALIRPAVGEQTVRPGGQELDVADTERGLGAAEREERAVQGQDRSRIAALGLDRGTGRIGRHRQPGLAGGEPAARAGRPAHRGAFGVATRTEDARRIHAAVGRHLHVRRPGLVAVVDGRRAAQREQQHRRGPDLGRPGTGGDARLVVVAEDPVRPGARRRAAS